VGGHCIGVDPYYLTHRAERAGYHPEVILAGRRINDSVGSWIAHACIKHLMLNGSTSKTVTVLGLTFKENVPDIRNSKVADIVRELNAFGVAAQVHDPLAQRDEAVREYGIKLIDFDVMEPVDAVILAVPHERYLTSGWSGILPLLKNARGLVMDVKSCLDRAQTPPGVELWRL
jgi:UDP-N-acetyl-D-glucosamine/UDP-N-acetyl-D-galactosamine dehydrogenase